MLGGSVSGRKAGATLIAGGISTLLLAALIVQANPASAAQSDVKITKRAPVAAAEFKGDVRKLGKPATVGQKPAVVPAKPGPVGSKQGPAAPPVPKADTKMPAPNVNFAGLDHD